MRRATGRHAAHAGEARRASVSFGHGRWLSLLLFALVCSSGCSSCQRPPAISEAAYREAVTAFFTGIAAMQTTQEVLAREKFERVVTLAPQEPAAWANVGLLLLRQQETEPAKERLTRAASLAPESAEIQKLLALLESRAGNLEAATRHWTRALELRPDDARAAFALARDLERQGGPEREAEAQRALDTLLRRHENLAARLELARLAAKRGDAAALRQAIAPLAQASAAWPPQAQAQLQAVQQSADNPRAAATRVAFIKNFLVREPEYRRAMSELTTPLEAIGEPLERFLVLKNPDPRPAAPDEKLTFDIKQTPGVSAGAAPRAAAPSTGDAGAGAGAGAGLARSPSATTWAGAVSLNGEGALVVMTATAAEVRIRPTKPAGADASRSGAPGSAQSRTAVSGSGAGPAATAGGSAASGSATSGAAAAGGATAGPPVRPAKPAPGVAAGEAGARVGGDASGLVGRFPGGAAAVAPGPDGVLAADLNYDFRTDLVLAGAGGVTLLRQEANGRFADVTAASALPPSVLRAPASGAWAADVDTDGDLDVVLAPVDGAPVVLRNNGDGTFAERTPFTGVTALRGFAWADFDGEGVPDAALVQADGSVRLFVNLRGGSFRELQMPGGFPKTAAIAAAEATGDSRVDLLALSPDGTIIRLAGDAISVATPAASASAAAAGAVAPPAPPAPHAGALAGAGAGVGAGSGAGAAAGRSPVIQVARVSEPPQGLAPGAARLLVADLDNNAAGDFIVSGPSATRVLLGAGAAGTDSVAPASGARSGDLQASQTFVPLGATLPLRALTAADVDEDGRLDLVGVQGDGAAVARNAGTKAYHWQRLRTRAATATGDQRINSFGIGGEVEVRTGLHVQTQLIASPIVHVGLGEAAQAEVIRIVWPNGVLQSEFEKPADTTVMADQRLKGSCPWLFAWNGREMGFVTDLIWRSPLGLRINAQATADVLMTEDRVRIRGDQLVARDGAYDLRITADLWETHFFDLVSLLVVDHPAGTEVFIDERFAIPAPSLEAVVTGPVRPFAAARAHLLGAAERDVSDLVRTRDDRHLDFAGRGAYQGITRDHAVELELPAEAPRQGPLWLVAQGWVHPTDSSINVAIAQGAHAAPRSLALEVADASGRFREVKTGLGFPSGKDKTVLLDLSGLFPGGAGPGAAANRPRRLRLSTNLEIFWDRLGWAEGRPDVRVTPRGIEVATAELRYRGFSMTHQKNASTPERPSYRIAGASPRWRDLEGFYTRFGDVRELLTQVDDRYVIMNAGDEIALRFPEAPPPAAGLVRDFVMIGDGWVKDGDFNTAFSRTVLPLPTHASGRYDRPPGRLEEDPVFRAHTRDFEVYHTRYVSPADRRR